MAGNSVSTEPSSRTSVGTLDFGLTRVRSRSGTGTWVATFSASYGLPISSNNTWMPREQAPGA